MLSLQVNTTSENGCNLYTCGVNGKGDLVLQTKVTTCPPFDRQACLDEGVRLLQERRSRQLALAAAAETFCTRHRC